MRWQAPDTTRARCRSSTASANFCRPVDLLEERGDVHRLGAVAVEAGPLGGLRVGRLTVAGERNQPNQRVRLAQLAGELVAVHPGQADVEDAHLRVERGAARNADGPSGAIDT